MICSKPKPIFSFNTLSQCLKHWRIRSSSMQRTMVLLSLTPSLYFLFLSQLHTVVSWEGKGISSSNLSPTALPFTIPSLPTLESSCSSSSSSNSSGLSIISPPPSHEVQDSAAVENPRENKTDWSSLVACKPTQLSVIHICSDSDSIFIYSCHTKYHLKVNSNKSIKESCSFSSIGIQGCEFKCGSWVEASRQRCQISQAGGYKGDI